MDEKIKIKNKSNTPVVYYIDNLTYDSNVYKKFPLANVGVYRFKKEKSVPLETAPEEIQNRQNINCDHGGLVLGSFLDIFGSRNPVILNLVPQPDAETTKLEEIFTDLSDVLHQKKSEWKGFCGYTLEEEKGFELAQRLIETKKNDAVLPDMICQSYVWSQSEKGLIEEEIERNAHFYLPAKKTPYSYRINTILTQIENEQSSPAPRLLDLLQNFRNTLTRLKKNGYALEDVYLSDEVQSCLSDIQMAYQKIKKAPQLQTPAHSEERELVTFCNQSILVLENLKAVTGTDGKKHLRCIENTASMRKEYLKEHSEEKVMHFIQQMDDLNVGVFTAESLRNYYKTFVHGLADFKNEFPLPRQDDMRVKMLESARTILFNNNLSTQAIPDSYHGLETQQIDRGGVSALIPKMAGLFGIARGIDSDIRQKEFCELILKSGKMIQAHTPTGTYGGILPDINRFKILLYKWKKERPQQPIWRLASPIERKNREVCFQQFLSKLNREHTADINYYFLPDKADINDVRNYKRESKKKLSFKQMIHKLHSQKNQGKKKPKRLPFLKKFHIDR